MSMPGQYSVYISDCHCFITIQLNRIPFGFSKAKQFPRVQAKRRTKPQRTSVADRR